MSMTPGARECRLLVTRREICMDADLKKGSKSKFLVAALVLAHLYRRLSAETMSVANACRLSVYLYRIQLSS